MAVALLEQVRAAEEKADAIRRKAADQARDMLKGVQEATQEENRQYAAELRARYQDKMGEARQAAEEAIRSRSGEKQQAGRKSRGADRGKGYAAWQSLK